ncbi:MAG: hypothetical protein P8M11_12955 [Planctomycetota bacterium]|nr:hypothetical protein [Planctomycetota bacterium]MDG1985468.1 hypothetical protein [Planctomycetota bacterium]
MSVEGGSSAYRLSESELVREPATVLAPGVLLLPVLTPAACRRLLEEISARREALGVRRPPSSMHDHGVMTGSIGMDGLVDQVREHLSAEISAHFPLQGGEAIDHHHSYLVEYGRGLDEDLGFHVDDSEVTVNLCLGEEFSGAELLLLGARCDVHRQSPVTESEVIEIEHQPGQAVIHAGRQRHRVDPIQRGVRRNLIAWLRSSSYRAAQEGQVPSCHPWCGLYQG